MLDPQEQATKELTSLVWQNVPAITAKLSWSMSCCLVLGVQLVFTRKVMHLRSGREGLDPRVATAANDA